jgi:hypothetical protein
MCLCDTCHILENICIILLIRKTASSFTVGMQSAAHKVIFCQPATQLIRIRFTDDFGYLGGICQSSDDWKWKGKKDVLCALTSPLSSYLDWLAKKCVFIRDK